MEKAYYFGLINLITCSLLLIATELSLNVDISTIVSITISAFLY